MTLIPDMRYPTPRELALAARALAEAEPGLVRLRQAGTSRGGAPLWLLSVRPARASRHVLVVAGAHANEPVGGATALELARRVIRDPAPRAGCGWHFLLCADPDGAALHRTPLPYSLLDYHRNFFRPPGPEQPEWAPSLLPPDRLPPETRALTAVIDELRPVLQVSLHGTDLGGSWVQLTRDIPGLAEPFGKSAAELRIPVETSASDAAGWPSPGPGIFVMPEPVTDTAAAVHPEDTRLSTWYHAHRYAGTTAIVEVPMWASDLVDDPAPHPDPRGALRMLAARLTEDAARVAAVRGGVPGAFRDDGAAAAPLLRAVDWTLALIPLVAAEWTGPGAPAEATAAHIGSIDAFGRRLSLRAAAMLLRVLRAGHHPAAPALDRLVTGWCEEFAARFQARWVPVATQVEHQSRTVLAAYERLAAVTPDP
ncbi:MULTISPECIES: M14 family zinc carboxypeptidase [Streptomyces]|uniref:M14 family zinc carboxypeptidase n=1 Tax=Streptomyces TaxID=1883 RepID=UPI00093D6B66|nr:MULTISPECIES: M14 family zinc carboxypeptidase [Streptomyces]OKI40187.1 3-hydroxyacyl-CoA dehydrogenase [Streptomyces sp. CB03578]WBY24262.1 M14 family zinc carboxypeptidase [Streptomyces goshikiensis]WSY02205.1 M14 family zinc carboxypeptidase [Streptomyces goshikiensis]